MTVPAIFFGTPHLVTSTVAFISAVILAYFGYSLLVVASGSAVAVFICELIFMLA